MTATVQRLGVLAPQPGDEVAEQTPLGIRDYPLANRGPMGRGQQPAGSLSPRLERSG